MTPVSRTPQARLTVPSLSMLHSCASAAAERIGAAASTSAILFLFLLLVGLPLGVVLVQSFFPAVFDPLQPNWSFSVEALSRTFSSVRTFSSILNSLLLAGVVAVAATLVGAAYAVAVTRTDLPFPSACAVLPWLVFLTPAYLKGLAWVLLMSSGGYLAQLGLLSPAASDAFFTPAGLIFVHTLNLFPLSYFIMASALVGLGSEFEDAARLFGASPWRTWVSINAPLLGPALVLSALAIFAEVLSDFGLASTIARLSGFGLLTYGIYVAANDFPVDFALAGSQAIILLSMVLAVVLADRVIRRQVVARLISWRSRPARLYRLRRWSWLVLTACLMLAVAALVLPLLAICIRAVSSTLGQGLHPGNLTSEFIRRALTWDDVSNRALLRSLGFAGLTAVIAGGLGLLLALRLARATSALRPIVLVLALGAVAIPGIVLAFGYILVWNRIPGFRDLPFPRYGDASLVVVGYVAAALPYCLLIILSAVDQLAPSLTDAARLQGVGWTGRVLGIVLPLVATSVVTAALFTFIRTVFELPMSVMLVPQSGPLAPNLITRLFAHDGDGMASALAMVSMVAVALTCAAVWLATGSRVWRARPASDGEVILPSPEKIRP